MPDLKLTILTPLVKLIDDQQVNVFRLKLSDGKPLSIHPMHAPLIAQIGNTQAEYEQNGIIHLIQINNGVLRVFRNHIICAVESANLSESGIND